MAGNLPVIAGSVTIDRANSYRRSATNVTFVDPTGALTPLVGAGGGYLKPYGYEMKLFKGINVAGVKTYAQLGTFLISEVDVKDGPNGLTLIAALHDRGEWVSRLGFTTTATSNYGGTPLVLSDAIIWFFTQAYSGITGVSTTPFAYTHVTTTYIPPTSYAKTGDDPWKIMSDLAASGGYQLYFDYTGALILANIPTTATAAVSFTESTPSAPHELSRALSNQNVPNIICVESSSSKINPPIRVWWWDSVVGSPTFYAGAPAGGFSPSTPQITLATQTGTYPATLQRFQTMLAQTSAAAQSIANSIGAVASGSMEKATFSIRDYPGLDVDDGVGVTRVRAGISGGTVYLIDHVQIALDVAGGTQFTGRPVQWIS